MNDVKVVDKKQPRNNPIDRIPPEKRWLPGQSGNPAGRPKDSVTTLLKEMNHKAVADKLYALALAGDMKAIDVFLDRTEGKVTEKHLNVNVQVSPESILEAQDRLLKAQEDTKALLEKFPGRDTK